MKILWLSSVQLINGSMLVSGTWIPGLLSILEEYHPEIKVVNITMGNVKAPVSHEAENLKEWIIPSSKKMGENAIHQIKRIIDSENPDLIQVWGTEYIWGEFPFKSLTPEIPVILEIQGLLESVSEEYYGGLKPFEFLRCWNIKEMIKPSSSLPLIRRLYTKGINRERDYLNKFDNIGVQSHWTESIIRTINPNATFFRSDISLRAEFYHAAKWECLKDKNPVIFSTAITGQPLKGAFTLFKAFAIVKEWFPDAKLVLAGAKEEGIRKSGFCRMLFRYAKNKGFLNDIQRLGPLNATQLAEQYRRASVFVNPSNWESYSVVTAEAMYIGCPTVASYASALPELGQDGSILYFSKGDFRMCAALIMEILNNPSMASELSRKSIAIGGHRQDRKKIAENQMNTYIKLISQRRQQV